MKKCFKCGAEKPYTDFYKHSKMADGHLGKCKECTKLDVKKHRKENDSVREYDRSRGNRQTLGDLQRYRAENPKKYKAHGIVARLIRSGAFVRPIVCSECPSSLHVEAHHDDYDKPKEVRWLCSRCHSLWHAANGEASNPF